MRDAARGPGGHLRLAPGIDFEGRVGSGRLSLVRAAESAAAGMDALDSPRFRLSPELERQLLQISARNIDYRLRREKRKRRRRLYGRTKPGTLLKHHIPLKTDHWDVQVPGDAISEGRVFHAPRFGTERVDTTRLS
ncbi:MAG: hypothetical protein WB763_07435 [Terriglobia bacterium]|jgi:hypothetical protein